jgi:hypothetical protein
MRTGKLDTNQQGKNNDMNEANKMKKIDEDREVIKEVQQVNMKRSERLKKDANLSTMEKVERESLEKNVEGNSQKTNSFVVLSSNDITHVTAKMGIVIDNDIFDTCNLLNDLELLQMIYI